MNAEPRLSIVVTARNDDHGGKMLRRMQIFLDGLLEQARRHGLNGELIIVEWNPPQDRPSLACALRWPKEPGPCGVRIIEVPATIHQGFQYADRLELFQMIAKNVGIRRARGEFVLSANVDLLFDDGLMEFMASGSMKGHCMYRTDRHDVSADVPLGIPITEQLDYCRRHVLRVRTRRGTFLPGQVWWVEVPRRVAARAVGRLLPTSPQATREIEFAMSNGLKGLFPHLWWPLHANACGDFTLLSRERWFALRGYPELGMFSLHLDAVFCHMAVAGGAREVRLADGMHLYHIEHGSGWSPGEAHILAAHIADLGIPILDYSQYRLWVNEARRRGAPVIFNHEEWGLGGERLRETDPIGDERRPVMSAAEHGRI